MITVAFLLWGILLAVHTLYSYNFLYRRISDRPLAFHQQKKILSALEIIAACLPIIVLTITRNILPAVVIIGVSILTRSAVKSVAYNRELREMTAFQQRENKMSKEEALDVARTLLDISIEHGERQ